MGTRDRLGKKSLTNMEKFGKEGVDTVVLLGMEFVSFGAFLLARSPISRNRKEREDFGTISDSLKFDSKI